jgi:hypothetical protein
VGDGAEEEGADYGCTGGRGTGRDRKYVDGGILSFGLNLSFSPSSLFYLSSSHMYGTCPLHSDRLDKRCVACCGVLDFHLIWCLGTAHDWNGVLAFDTDTLSDWIWIYRTGLDMESWCTYCSVLRNQSSFNIVLSLRLSHVKAMQLRPNTRLSYLTSKFACRRQKLFMTTPNLHTLQSTSFDSSLDMQI